MNIMTRYIKNIIDKNGKRSVARALATAMTLVAAVTCNCQMIYADKYEYDSEYVSYEDTDSDYSPVDEYLKSLEGKYSGGDGSKENPWKIATVEDLLFMRTDRDRDGSYGMHKHYFELTEDIVFNEDYKNYKSWGKKAPKNKLDAPIDRYGENYSLGYACLNGNGHTIYGLYAEDNSLFNSLYLSDLENINFSCFYTKNTPLVARSVSGGSLKNIKIDKGEVVFKKRAFDEYRAHYSGGVFDEIMCSIDSDIEVENITVDINMTSDNEWSVGLFAGSVLIDEECALKSVTTKGKLTVNVNKTKKNSTNYQSSIGAIAGETTGSFKNCLNKAKISVNLPASKNASVNIGGLAGQTMKTVDSKGKLSFENCTNEGGITVTSKYDEAIAKKQQGTRQNSYAAGIVSEMSAGTIKNCLNKGNISAEFGYSIAGIANNCRDNIIIDNCLNKGKLSSVACGTVAGIVNSFQGKVTHCENQGDLSTIEKLIDKNDFFCGMTMAGIAGEVRSENRASSIEWCKNSGHIKAIDEALWATTSGIAGSISQYKDKPYTNSLSNCFNEGIIEGCLVSGIVDGTGTYAHYGYKGRNQIKNSVNAGKLIHNYADDRVAGIVFSSCYTDIVNCANFGDIVKTVKNPWGDIREGQIVSLNNEGSVVNDCYILTASENKWPATAINQNGGTTKTVTAFSSSQIKKLKFVKKVMKKSGVKKKSIIGAK